MPECPFCHSPPLPLGVGLPAAYQCGTVGLSRSKECRELAEKLEVEA